MQHDVGNKSPVKKVMVQCSTAVNKNSVRREMRDGVEHIIVASATLPDNIVMNGMLYPAEAIDASFQSLERTLAPIEHPVDSGGFFIPAGDPEAIHNFYAGAFNTNVRKENGRVLLDKVINVQEATKTDRGKRLLDRINEIETSDKPRPIHTSTGIFLSFEETSGTNADGQEYSLIAQEMVFDHDAILLDSIGAATPEQGVGMALNSGGDKVDVLHIVLNDELPQTYLSHDEIREMLRDGLNKPQLKADWIEEVFNDSVIYQLDEELFTVPYRIDNGVVTIAGIPLPVEKNVQFIPKTNRNEGDEMKELMLNALKEAGVEVSDEATDAEILQAYNELHSDSGDNEGADSEGKLAKVVENALKPVTDELSDLKATLKANESTAIDEMAEVVGNSAKYPGIDVETARVLPVEKLKELAANCGHSYGVPTVFNAEDTSVLAPADMPE